MSDSKKRKSRRSSILKPPKPRNPLSDVDLNPPSETTIMKSRRVSFANVHFKKEFTADPEKNTIWHTSYEEEMNKSDHSEIKNSDPKVTSSTTDINMSVEDMSLDSDIMNCTHINNLDTSLEAVLANNSFDTSIISATIDLTEHHNKKASLIGSLQNHIHFQEVEQHSFHLASNEVGMEMTQIVDSRKENDQDHPPRRQTIHYQQESAELDITVPVPPIIHLPPKSNRKTINFNTNSEDGNMDLTQAVTVQQSETKRQTIHFNNEADGATMELTQSVPAHVLLNLKKQKQQTLNLNTSLESGHMDMTQSVSTEITEKENQCSTKRQTIHFNNETEGATMEFTQSVPSHVLSNLIKRRQTQNKQLINSKTSSECGNITQVESSKIVEKENQYTTKRQTIHFNNETEGATMEFTQSVSSHMISNLNKGNQTQKQQTISSNTSEYGTEITQENKSSSKRQTIHFNNETEGGTMEITESIPPQLLSNLIHQKKRQTINFKAIECGDMDITQVVSNENVEKENQCTTKRQTIHFTNENEGATLEFTQSVPPQLLSNLNHHQQKRQTINLKANTDAGNVDKTQNLTAEKENQCTTKRRTMQNNHHQQKRQTINFNANSEFGNMDITQGLTAEIAEKENQCTAKRQTIHFNNETEGATMEFTQSVPPELLSNLIHQKKRQTINFKANSEFGNMDITQGLTAEKENQSTAKRQTIHFNNETEGATMEITQSVPPELLSNLIHQKKRQTINFKANSECGNMDITQALTAEIAEKENQCTTKRQTIHFNNDTEAATMEFTQSVPTELLSNLNHHQQNRQTLNFKANTDNINIDITQAVSAEITEKENQRATKRQTMHFNNETEGATMEFTQAVPLKLLSNLNQHQQKRQTINFNTNANSGNMDITQGLTAENEIQCTSKRQTIHFNNETDGVTMDFTQSVPPQLLSNLSYQQKRQTLNFKANTQNSNIDMTQTVSAEIAEKENQCTRKRQTIHYNNETEGATMEFTQSVPPHVLLNLNKEHQAQKRQTINFKTSSIDADMNITQAVSTDITEKEKEHITKRQTMHFNNETEGATMEFTQSVPSHLLSNLNHQQKGLTADIAEKENHCTTKRQTMHFNNETEGATMEFTQSVPSHLLSNLNHQQKGLTADIAEKENHCTTKRQTMHYNNETGGATMEFTQSVPHQLLSNLNHHKQKRQTINFKANSEFGNMDITQGLTAEIAEKENQCRVKQQTMHFKNETKDAIKEFTHLVPSDMYLSKNKDSQTKHKRQAVEEDKCLKKILFNNEMEGAAMELSLNLNKDCQRQTTDFKTHLECKTMDITQAVSTEVSEKENQCRKRQKINLNNETQESTMELSPSIPSQLNKNCQRKATNFKTSSEDFEANIRHQDAEKDFKGTINRQTIHFITDTDGATIEITKFTPEQILYNQTSSTGNIEITESSIPAEIIQKSLQISKVVQDTLSFTNIRLESDSASIKTVDPYFPDSSIQETETLDKTQDNLPVVDVENIKTKENVHPINFDPNSSDICQRIKLPGQTDDYNVSKINLSDKIDLTPVKDQNSFNLTEDLTRILDSTNKLIHRESDVSVSEYSKIISDKNYSIADTSFPDNFVISLDNSKNMSNNLADSIISVNSSIEIDKSIQNLSELELIMKEIKPPPKYDYNLNLEEELAKLPKIQSTKVTSIQQYISVKELLQIFDIDLDRFKKEKNDTQNLIYPQYQYEDKGPDKMYKKFEELVRKKNLAQEEKQQTNKKPTLEDKIKRMINKDTLWNLISNEEFSFTFMGNSIKIIAQVDRATQIVKHVEFFPQIDESKCPPIWIYIHRIQREKLSQDQIKSAIGQNYNIFTLLDYLTKIGEDLMDILQEYDHLRFNIGVQLDRSLNATLLFTNLFLRLSFEVTINVNNLDNMTGDSISVKNLVGVSDKNALKRLIKHCPPGFSFFREYDRLVKDYLKVFQHSRQK